MATIQPLGESDSVPPAAATLARISAIVVPKRTRASRPKVRTGCGTCKKRHVKCDETRPTCVRCEQAGAECSGYKPVRRDLEGKPARKDPIQRQVVESMALEPRVPWSAPDFEDCDLGYPIPPPGSTALQLHDEEVMYYDFFRYQLAHDLMGCFPCNFWTETVLNEAMRNDCVLHSMIAISALSRSLEQDPAALQEPFDGLPVVALVETSQTLSNLHARQAMRHYTKAMGLFRAHIGGGDDVSAREVLVVTLLFVAYELLQGNITAADSLLHSGSVLLKHKMLPRGGSSPLRHCTPSSDAAQLEQMLTRLLVSSYFSPVTTSPTSIFYFESAGNPHVDVPVLGQTTVFDFFQLWKEFTTRAFAFVQQHLASILLNLSFDMEASRQNQAEYLRYLRLWREALYDFAQSNRGDVYHAGLVLDEAMVARGLRIVEVHIIMCHAFMSGCLDRTGLAYDAYDASYRAIIDLTAPLVAESTPANRPPFTFDIALVPMVGFIVSCCRKRSIRMEALELYRKMSWREGAWDSHAMTIGKLGLIRLEESGATASGFIPPESRYYWTGSSWDPERRKLLATYYRMMPDDRGRPVVKEILLDM
ncbi:hypothetical protein GQ53DRAFT_750488 [Thozetella sp. PMI_491]|nr:hypothetical protein GQ53DRAFT_750488 [Thozetella sp. PMI_491]